jgi:hypothetical protein
MKQMKRILGIGLIITLCAGCGQAATVGASGGTSTGLTANAQTSPPPPISGGTAAQRQLVVQIFGGMGSTAITGVQIGDPPSQFATQPGSSWINITVPPGDLDMNQLAEWQAATVAGAFHDESTDQNLPNVAGYSTPQSTQIIVSGGGSVVGSPPGADAITKNLQSMGLTVNTITTLHPDVGSAVIVSATASDPVTFAKQFAENADHIAFGNIGQFEGTYLQVDNSAGNGILTYWQATRVQAGAGSVAPAYRTDVPGSELPSDLTCTSNCNTATVP